MTSAQDEIVTDEKLASPFLDLLPITGVVIRV